MGLIFFASMAVPSNAFVPQRFLKSQVKGYGSYPPTYMRKLSTRCEPIAKCNGLKGVLDDDDNSDRLENDLTCEHTNLIPEAELNGETNNILKISSDGKSRAPDASLLSTIGKYLANTVGTISSYHAALAATVLLFLAVFLGPLPSLAVGSGGRMGGSFGPSERSSSVRTYRAPSSSYSRGFSSGYYSRPSVVVTPSVPVVTPYYSSPFYSPLWAPRPSGVVVSTGPSFLGIFGFLAVALVAFSFFSTTVSNVGSSVMDKVDSTVGSVLGPGISVSQITVALDVPDREDPSSILGVLNRLSNKARTDSRVGVQNLTSQVALELLRKSKSIVAASSRYTHFRDNNKASREFNKLAVQERGKFERETVSRYGGVDYTSGDGRSSELSQYPTKATMAVVTIIVAIGGDSTKMPVISSPSDVENALSRIASDAKVGDCLQSAEILWTPEERSETLTMREVISDYPSLRTI